MCVCRFDSGESVPEHRPMMMNAPPHFGGPGPGDKELNDLLDFSAVGRMLVSNASWGLGTD